MCKVVQQRSLYSDRFLTATCHRIIAKPSLHKAFLLKNHRINQNGRSIASQKTGRGRKRNMCDRQRTHSSTEEGGGVDTGPLICRVVCLPQFSVPFLSHLERWERMGASRKPNTFDQTFREEDRKEQSLPKRGCVNA